ncbi:MAG: hypothetical protein GY722_27170, partial [bacterium]|nr:hypothetical protein [bacterium]
IVTIQPAGARFEPPARLTLPNVEGLAPGEVTEMYSFDHDLGHFVSIGPATVSDDGMVMRSDPGVGIVKAGWHCGGNPASEGTLHQCEKCTKCEEDTCVADPGQNGDKCEDDGDRCTVDFCQAGSCIHPRKRIEETDAKANGEDSAEIFIDGCVSFSQTSNAIHCDVDFFNWDFGDGSGSSSSTPSNCYPDPGNFQYRLDVGCDSLCAENSDNGSVRVKCPKVEITSVEPDVDYLCPGCTIELFLDVDPPSGVQWRVDPPSSGTIAPTAADRAVFTAAGNAVSGAATIEVAVAGKFDFDECVDSRSVYIYNHGTGNPAPRNIPCLISAGVQAGIAQRVTKRALFGGDCTRDNNDPWGASAANAWLHATVSCSMTVNCGAATAEQMGFNREDTAPPGQNPCIFSKMDLHNNKVGRQLGFTAVAGGASCGDLALEALQGGLLRFYNQTPNPPPGAACHPMDSQVPAGHPCFPGP